MLGGVIESRDDVGKIAGAVRGERLQRKNLGLGSDKVDQTGGHGAVAEGSVVPAIKHSGGGLVENGGGGLLDVARLLVLRIGINVAVPQFADVEPFRGAGLIARKVVSREQDGLQDRVIDVHAGINDGDDAGATDAEAVLGVLKPDNLGRGLG